MGHRLKLQVQLVKQLGGCLDSGTKRRGECLVDGVASINNKRGGILCFGMSKDRIFYKQGRWFIVPLSCINKLKLVTQIMST
jgi:hypothetical protein